MFVVLSCFLLCGASVACLTGLGALGSKEKETATPKCINSRSTALGRLLLVFMMVSIADVAFVMVVTSAVLVGIVAGIAIAAAAAASTACKFRLLLFFLLLMACLVGCLFDWSLFLCRCSFSSFLYLVVLQVVLLLSLWPNMYCQESQPIFR